VALLAAEWDVQNTSVHRHTSKRANAAAAAATADGTDDGRGCKGGGDDDDVRLSSPWATVPAVSAALTPPLSAASTLGASPTRCGCRGSASKSRS
jgi:hypothetical protein